MISEKEVAALLDRIEHSASFGSSSTYSRLLRFLVESTSSGTIPKEREVAGHLFGTNHSGSDSSKVRVYVYNLRKKLGLYFEKEGKEETYILTIPKGSYKVQFKKKKAPSILPVLPLKTKYWLYVVMALLLLWISSMMYFISSKHDVGRQIFAESVFWKTYFEDDRPIQVVIGDLLIYSELDSLTGEVRNVRNPEINTLADFEKYKNLGKNARRNLSEVTYSYLPEGSTEWISNLTKIFYPQKDFNLRIRSNIEVKDLHDYNIVFVGLQKTAGILNNYFDRSAFVYDQAKFYQYQLQKGEELLTYKPTGDPNENHTDYGFIARYPGPDNNTIFMFCGLWDSAASESLRNFAESTKIEQMEDYMHSRLGYVPMYFEMLLEVSGIDRIGLSAKVIHFNEVK